MRSPSRTPARASDGAVAAAVGTASVALAIAYGSEADTVAAVGWAWLGCGLVLVAVLVAMLLKRDPLGMCLFLFLGFLRPYFALMVGLLDHAPAPADAGERGAAVAPA
jgi:hypothetical protein